MTEILGQLVSLDDSRLVEPLSPGVGLLLNTPSKLAGEVVLNKHPITPPNTPSSAVTDNFDRFEHFWILFSRPGKVISLN